MEFKPKKTSKLNEKHPTKIKKEKKALSKKGQNRLTFWLFLIPAGLPFIIMVILPFFLGTYYSFTDWAGRPTAGVSWIGLENYSRLLEGPGARHFVFAFTRTFIYAGLNVVLINIVAFMLALLVVNKLKLRNLYRAGFFLPNLIGGLILGYIWQFIYNEALTASGIMESSLIQNGDTALFALLIVVMWQYAGYIMMIYIAALQNVPQDLIEASKIDGASALQRLRHVVFPLITQAFTVAMFLTLTTAFKQFDTVVSLTQGGPATLTPQWLMTFLDIATPRSVQSTQLITNDIYETGYTNKNFALGQAKAIVFFIILGVFALGQVYFSKKREVEL
ncbi:MAG: sugar ABC transporter permease [Tenericutes bacterium]|jgi:raffinose/stachyose/melibiose transport system permease protein|nr:sugar ABC transporter permease [Mycoplasmatota bacterium]